MSSDPPSNEPRKRVHSARIDLRWRDMDLNHHVNNVVYFRYFEQARIEWLHDAVHAWRDQGQGIVIANAYCNFLKALTYPATIEVLLSVGPPGRSSFTFYYDLHLQGEPAVKYADGYTRVAWIDRRSGRSIPLPDSVRALLA